MPGPDGIKKGRNLPFTPQPRVHIHKLIRQHQGHRLHLRHFHARRLRVNITEQKSPQKHLYLT